MLIRLSQVRIGNRGLTLVEVIIAMALVAIVVTMLFPMVFFAEKRMMENRNRMAAKAISQKQLEAIRSTITTNNYFDSLPAGDYGPALVAAGTSLDIRPYDGTSDGNPVGADGSLNYTGSGPKFYVKTTIAWVDDPADGTQEGLGSQHDDMPFDYKELVIRVATNSVFNDEEVIRGDFKTLLAMEGGEEPYSGIVVKVVHGWPAGIDDRDRSPVFGASVRLAESAPSSPVDSSPWDASMSYTTNSKGEAVIPIDPDSFAGAATKDLWIKVNCGGFIEDPAQVRDGDWRRVTVTRFVTSTAYRRIEEPCTLNLSFNGQQLEDAVPVWDGTGQSWNVKLEPAANLPPGDSGERKLGAGETSVQFENLWPASSSQYNLAVNLKAWEEQLEVPGDWSTWPGDRSRMDLDGTVYYNLWEYGSGVWFSTLFNDPRWRSVPPEPDPLWSWFAAGENRLLSNTGPAVNYIPLGRYAPLDVPVAGQSPVSSQRGVILSWDQELQNASSPGDFPMLYVSLGAPDDAAADSGGTPETLGSLWRPVASLNVLLDTANTSATHKEIKLDMYNGVAVNNMFSDSFRLRFDSSPGVQRFAIDRLALRCQYEKGFYFTAPGQNVDYTVTSN